MMALYDPREFPTETKVGADFTLADVLAWARTKPADDTYCYADTENCAVCQFLLETGRAHDPNVIPSGWADGEPVHGARNPRPLDERVDSAAVQHPMTFGAFAGRLEKALAR